MSFFHSLFGTCCGVDVFSELRKNSWWRVFLHLFLLCVLCSIAIGIGNYLLIKYRWRAAYNSFDEIFGTRIQVSERGFFPEKDPDVSRRQEFPYNTLLIYASPQDPETYPSETLRDRNVIIYWSQSCLALFIRSHNLWTMTEILPDFSRKDKQELNFEEVEKEIVRLGKLPPSQNWNVPTDYKSGISSSQMFRIARIGVVIGKALLFFVGELLLVLFVTLFFSIVYRAFAAKKVNNFRLGELWKISVYAAFPVILVMTAFPALQLPLTEYCSYMFIVGWSIYLFFVLKYLAGDSPENNSDDSEGASDEQM